MRRSLLFLFAICAMFLVSQSSQAQTILFDLEGKDGFGLLTGNDIGAPTGSGSGGELGGISYDVGSSLLTIDVGWGSGNGFTDLTGIASAMHIHGPANFFETAGVKYPLNGLGGFNSSASNGGLNDSVTIAGGDVDFLLDGQFYINVHTAANPGGEIRGNLVQVVPEPSSLMVIGLSGLAFFARRRRIS